MRISKAILRYKRNQAVQYARDFARQENLLETKKWLEIASNYQPLTDMQMHNIKVILGPYKYDELNLSKVKIKEV